MPQSNENSLIINDAVKLCNDISALYLSKKFSDVVLVVDEEKLFAHKTILAARSKYFAVLLFEDEPSIKEHHLTGITTDTLKKLLKYIYTGTITLDASSINSDLEIIGLANKYHLEDLQIPIISKTKKLINSKNVFTILDMASLYNLQELIDDCHKFLDENAGELRSNDGFNNLSQTSMIHLLQRDTFVLPEVDIFNIVLNWRKFNTDLDNLVVKCVRFEFMSVVEIVSKVWPSKVIKCEEILTAISQIVDVKSKTGKRRAQSELDINLATLKYNSEVTSGTNCTFLLSGNRDVGKYCYQPIDGKSGITVKLGSAYLINNIVFRLYDADVRHYMYYIEGSMDGKQWVKVLDYSKYSCRSEQNLYFEPIVTKFIKIVGTFHTLDKNIHLIFFEAYYRSSVPNLLNNVVIPSSNVATTERKAVLLEGSNSNNGSSLIDGVMNKPHFTYHKIGAGSIMIQLAQPYIISSLKLRLYDLDDRSYKYYIETSYNKSDWELAVDRKNQECKSWQHLTFSERVTSFIRITGTFESRDPFFHIIYIESPSPSVKK